MKMTPKDRPPSRSSGTRASLAFSASAASCRLGDKGSAPARGERRILGEVKEAQPPRAFALNHRIEAAGRSRALQRKFPTSTMPVRASLELVVVQDADAASVELSRVSGEPLHPR